MIADDPSRLDVPPISGFEVLTRLSSGGMGDVLLARRRGAFGFEKLLAIKTIRGELTKRLDIQAMFLDEARLSARLDHPNIAQVYDFGDEGGALYLAMEYVPGLALNKLIQHLGGPVPPAIAMRIMVEVCRGLHAAHELAGVDGQALGVVHRDVTPGNLILTFEGRMKILDFGIAFMHGRESPDTVAGELKGKPSYMAPEHLRGDPVDRRADIYSACVVLYELLTGRKLFARDTVFMTMRAVEGHRPPPPSSIVGPLPSDLDALVLRGIEKRAEDRFPDARTLGRELERILARSGGDTLEAFVESELQGARERHRAWLAGVQAARRGDTLHQHPRRPESSGLFEAPIPLVARLDRAHSEGVGGLPAQAAPGATSAPPSSVSPLADPTTLVPPPSDVPTRVRGSRAPRWAGACAALLALAGVGFHLHGEGPVIEVAPSAPPLAREVYAALPAPDPQPPPRAPSAPAPEAEPPPEAPSVSPPLRAPRRTTREPTSTARAAKAPEARPNVEDRYGFVTIGAQPYALVRIDGQDAGATPIMRRRVSAGTHEILFLRPDTGEVRMRRLLAVAADEHQRVTIP